jgi:hypothetical protein
MQGINWADAANLKHAANLEYKRCNYLMPIDPWVSLGNLRKQTTNFVSAVPKSVSPIGYQYCEFLQKKSSWSSSCIVTHHCGP